MSQDAFEKWFVKEWNLNENPIDKVIAKTAFRAGQISVLDMLPKKVDFTKFCITDNGIGYNLAIDEITKRIEGDGK